MLLEQRSDEGCVARYRIVEGQDDGTGFRFFCHDRVNREREKERKAKEKRFEFVNERHGIMSSHGYLMEARPISWKQSNSRSVDEKPSKTSNGYQTRV